METREPKPATSTLFHLFAEIIGGLEESSGIVTGIFQFHHIFT
jgi:hypothetical protein